MEKFKPAELYRQSVTDAEVQDDNGFVIGVLSEKLKEYESTYANAIDVKERIEREPEEFTWKWSNGGYWVSVYNSHPTDIKELKRAIRIMSAYRKPSADQDEIDRAIAIFQEHIDEAKKIVGHKPDCKYCEASTLAITALRRMAGEGK